MWRRCSREHLLSLGPNVATPLYPHQRKALTFLLEREREKGSGNSGWLWQVRKDASGRPRAWFNPVTGKEVQKEPPQDKGGILADDVRNNFDMPVGNAES
jgi:SWI/SNF-related matrix-associated actin-dependent regulator of chromatin subfamily A3